MRFIYFLIFFITACSATAQLFDDWVEEGDDFKAGDVKIDVSWTGQSAFLESELGSKDVPLGECRNLPPINICFDDTRLTLDGDVVPDNINSQDTKTELHLIVTSKLGDLEINRDIADRTILIGQKVDIKLTIENIGEGTASEIEFSDDFPSSVEVRKLSGCTLEDNEVTWTGLLRSGAKTICEYEVLGVKDKRFSSVAQAEYYNGIEDEKARDSQSVEILDYVLEIWTDAKTAKIQASDEVKATINAFSHYEQPIEVNRLQLHVPPGLRVTDRGDFNAQMYWKGTIEPEANLTFNITLLAFRTGEHVLNLSADYKTENVRQAVDSTKKFRIQPDVETQLDWNTVSAKLNQPFTLKAELLNTGDKPIYNVGAVGSTDMPGLTLPPTSIQTLGVRNNYYLLDLEHVPDTAGSFYIRLNVTYRNSQGEEFQKQLSQTVNVGGTPASTNSDTGTQASNTDSQAGQTDELWNFQMPDLDLSGENTKSGGLYIIIFVLIAASFFVWLRFKVKHD